MNLAPKSRFPLFLKAVCLWVLFFFLSELKAFCYPNPTLPLMPGDLLFQTAGDSRFSDAISSSTASEDSLSFVHVGMFYITDKGEEGVIEASPADGVRIVTLVDFIDSSPKVNGKPGVIVKRLKIPFPVETAISEALTHLGEPYDWYYLPDNGMMYCSELIYESYLNYDGSHIFKASPMNFRNPDGTMPDFWTELYEQLNCPVPEGIPGTNPNDLSRDIHLSDIYRFF